MRYVVVSKGLTISQLQSEVSRCGGRNIKVASVSRQIFCDLDDKGLAALRTVPGLVVKSIGGVSHQQISSIPVETPLVGSSVVPATYASSLSSVMTGIYQLRAAYSPPVTGQGYTLCVLDTGIRKDHEALAGKVVHEANFTSSPTTDDIFDHGTGVAYVAAGGRHAAGEESGFAPGANLMNIKVLDDEGKGDDETVVMGIEECVRLNKEAVTRQLSRTDPMNPGAMNMSFGKDDTGDPDDPIRLAIRAALEEQELFTIAAAGNSGPNPGTIMCPACDDDVLACGSMTFVPFEVWQYSSRGPTVEGLVKPDVAGFGVRMLTASSLSKDSYVVKSGTSFSAPTLSGSLGLFWEIFQRAYRNEELMMPLDQIKLLIPAYTVKPQGYPAGKDSNIGWGVISGAAAATAASAGVTDITQLLGPMVTMAMMPMILKAVK